MRRLLTSDRVIIPTGTLVLPGNANNVFVIVRRQEYHPSVPGDTRFYSEQRGQQYRF